MIQAAAYWVGLGLTFGLFWLLPRSVRYGFLAAASLAIIACVSPRAAAMVGGLSLLFHGAAPYLREERQHAFPLLVLCLGLLFSLLFCFKYATPLRAGTPGWVVPLGLSYFTFKLGHVALEARQGAFPDRSAQLFFCYMFLFPTFSAGPIERYDHFLAHRSQAWSLTSTCAGLTRIAWGLIKQFLVVEVLIAHAFAWNGLAGLPDLGAALARQATLSVWLFLALKYLYIYINFSAYSDLAIGASRLFWLGIMENFNLPVLATSLPGFWRRWHMTLSGWCQAYIYMPVLGRTRRPVLALYLAFAAIGLWHAGTLTRLAWGVFHGTGVLGVNLWTRHRRQRRLPPIAHPAWPVFTFLATQLFVIASMAFLVDETGHGLRLSLRLLARLLFLNLP